MKLGSKKILLTGATGFVGRNLLQFLVKRGYNIRILVRKSSNLTPLRDVEYEKFFGDLLDYQSLTTAVEGINLVVHAAAKVSSWGSYEHFKQINVDGTENLLRAISSGKTKIDKFLYLSSIAVYNNCPNGVINEESCKIMKSGWPYADTKIEAEQLVKKYGEIANIPFTIIRVGDVLGPDSIWIKTPVNLIQRHLMFVVDHGEGLMNYLWVDDLLRSIRLILENEISTGKTYNIVGGVISFGRYFSDLSKILGKLPPKSIPYRIAYILYALSEFFSKISRRQTEQTVNILRYINAKRTISTRKAESDLDWRTQISYTDIVEKIKATLSS